MCFRHMFLASKYLSSSVTLLPGRLVGRNLRLPSLFQIEPTINKHRNTTDLHEKFHNFVYSSLVYTNSFYTQDNSNVSNRI